MAGFSKDGEIPWINEDFAKEDLRRFKQLTDGNVCIMGRKTYEDITKYAKDKGFFEKNGTILPNRECVVLSRQKNLEVDEGIIVKPTLRKAIEHGAETGKGIFIIGGGALFLEALSWNIGSIYVTLIDKDYDCDKFFHFRVLMKKFYIADGKHSKSDLMKFIEYRPRQFGRR